MKRLLAAGIIAGGFAAAIGWIVAAPDPLPASALGAHTANIENGKRLFTAAGCLSCHLPAKEDKQADVSLPSGGRALKTPAGIFYPPNITPDSTGIKGWTDIQFINAVKGGISPKNAHYLPAFPYTSYVRMSNSDVLDIKAYIDTLKPVQSSNRQPDLPLGLPVETVMRRSLGIWKIVAGFGGSVGFTKDASRDDIWNRGAYLVLGPGHCAECHTPRNWALALDASRWLAGGPHPEGSGQVPSLRNLKSRKRFKDAKDLATALEFGETLGYDKMSSGGMAAVQTNMSKLPAEDRMAIATYLMSLE